MITNIKLPEPGQRVGVVDGPGQFPEHNAGIVMTIVKDKWQYYALVMMDDGKTKTCHGLNSGPGIGWHALVNKYQDNK